MSIGKNARIIVTQGTSYNHEYFIIVIVDKFNTHQMRKEKYKEWYIYKKRGRRKKIKRKKYWIIYYNLHILTKYKKRRKNKKINNNSYR